MISSSLKPSLLSVLAVQLLSLSTSQAILDTNSNGLSDVWEIEHNNGALLSTANSNHASTADPDQDGWTNAQEALAGTNPFDGSIPTGKTTLRIAAAAQASTYELTWPAIPGKKYRLQTSSDLNTWVSVGNSIPAEPSDTQLTLAVQAIDPAAPSTAPPPRIFWRIAIIDHDADIDGLTTAEEHRLGLNPNDPITLAPLLDITLATQKFRDLFRDGLSEVAALVEPFIDSDLDELINLHDAVPDDPQINWIRTPQVRYVWIEQVNEIDPLHQPIAINKDAQILFYDDRLKIPHFDENQIKILWDSASKQWTMLPLQGSQQIQIANQSITLTEKAYDIVDINDNGTIFGIGHGQDYVANEPLIPGMIWKRNANSTTSYQSPSYFFPAYPFPQIFTQMALLRHWNIRQHYILGAIAADGSINTQSYDNVGGGWMIYESDVQPLTYGMNKIKEWDVSDRNQTFPGSILDKNRALFVEKIHGASSSKIWLKEAASNTDISFMNAGKVISLAEMSELPPCNNGKTPRLWITTGEACYIEKRFGNGNGIFRWHKAQSMEGENIIRMNARGEALANKNINGASVPKLWRNGKYTELNNKELTSKPDNVTITKAIDLASNGIILAQATENGVKKTGILYPIAIEPDANMKGVIGDVVKSAKLGSAVKHFVTPKKTTELSQQYVELKAAGVDAQTFNQFFTWEGGEEGSSAEKRKVKRDVANVFEIKIRYKQSGAVAAEMHVWVVWCTVTPTPVTAQFLNPSFWNFSSYRVFNSGQSPWRFVFAIQPSSIITALERPALDGKNTNPAPGADKTYFTDPARGAGDTAKLKWDVSRQMKQTVFNPQLIPKEDLLASNSVVARYKNQPLVTDTPLDFPELDYEGNDDSIEGIDRADEDANPYVARGQTGIVLDTLAHQIGELSSSDNPQTNVYDSWGANMRKFGINIDFREFARLEIFDGETESKKEQFWYRISDYQLWHHSLSAEFKASSSKWEDSGSKSGVGPTP